MSALARAAVRAGPAAVWPGIAALRRAAAASLRTLSREPQAQCLQECVALQARCSSCRRCKQQQSSSRAAAPTSLEWSACQGLNENKTSFHVAHAFASYLLDSPHTSAANSVTLQPLADMPARAPVGCSEPYETERVVIHTSKRSLHTKRV